MTILYIVLIFTALLGITYLGKKRGTLGPEAARKTIHVGMGIICLTFPWILNSPTQAWVLAAIAITTLAALRLKKFSTTIGSSLFAVNRISLGDILFPLSVAILFQLSFGNPILYTIPLLLLTFADALSALFGKRYGSKFFTTIAASKSVEGSLIFFLTGTLCVLIPLTLTGTPFLTAILIATGIAIFFTAVEGLSGAGSDNLFIPIGTYYLLNHYLTLDPNQLLARNIALLTLLALVIIIRKRHSFDGGALLGCVLFGTALLFLGNIYCLISALILLTISIITTRQIRKIHPIHHKIDTLLSIAIAPIIALTILKSPTFCIASLTIIVAMLHTATNKHLNKKTLTPSILLKTTAVLSPILLLNPPLILIPLIYAAALTATIIHKPFASTEDFIPFSIISTTLTLALSLT